MKLNGWKRIGIVASLLWIIGGGIYAFEDRMRIDVFLAAETEQSCMDLHDAQERSGKKVDSNDCFKDQQKFLADMLPGEKLEAALVAFVPVPFAWGFAYLVLFVVHWVKRGFPADQNSN